MTQDLLYLSQSDVKSLSIPMAAVIERTETALREKADGKAIMPAKHWISPEGDRFFSAMSGALLEMGAVTCKWQSGSPGNARIGQPYITGLLILNNLETGMPKAIMDSTWITAQRTAAATAVTAKHLATANPRALAIIGCGVQGRTNLEALRIVWPSITDLHAFDIDPAKAESYLAEAGARYGVTGQNCASVQEVVADADIVVTCGPIVAGGDRSIECGWLKPGALLVTLDYDCYLNPAAASDFDGVFTDDVEQVQHLKAHGFFTSFPDDLEELAAAILGTSQGRQDDGQRFLSLNLGLAIEDTALADLIEHTARQRQVGRSLAL